MRLSSVVNSLDLLNNGISPKSYAVLLRAWLSHILKKFGISRHKRKRLCRTFKGLVKPYFEKVRHKMPFLPTNYIFFQCSKICTLIENLMPYAETGHHL